MKDPSLLNLISRMQLGSTVILLMEYIVPDLSSPRDGLSSAVLCLYLIPLSHKRL
jgi:hypothetical protein